MLKYLAATAVVAAVALPATAPAAACDLGPHSPPLVECVLDTAYEAIGTAGNEEDCGWVTLDPPSPLRDFHLWICRPPAG